MSTRNLSIVVGILALVAGALFLSDRKGSTKPDPDPRVGTTLTTTDTWEAVHAVHLLENGELKVRMQRAADGHWFLPDEDGLPVNFASLARMANQLVEARISRFVTRRAERLERLETHSTSLILLPDGESADPLLSLHFGKRSDAGGIYVQFGDDPAAYLVADPVYLAASVDAWIDRDLLPLNPGDVRALSVVSADGSLEIQLERSGPAEPFALKGSEDDDKEVNQETVNGWLNDLSSMRFTKHTEIENDEAVEARSYVRSYQIDTFDGHTWRLHFGRRPEQATKPGTDAPGDNSGEPETIPAGKAFAFVDAPEGITHNIPYSGLAFEIASYSFSRQPGSSDWLVAKDPPEEPAAPVDPDR